MFGSESFPHSPHKNLGRLISETFAPSYRRSHPVEAKLQDNKVAA